MAVSVPLSRYLMSVSQFILTGLWILYAIDYERIIATKTWLKPMTVLTETALSIKRQVVRFWHCKPAVVFVSFYLLHVAGLTYSSDIESALKDLRIKLPLLSIPVLLTAMPPLSRKQIYQILILHALAVFGGTLSSLYFFFFKDFTDFRELFPWFSHIRFSLNLVLTVFSLSYVLWTARYPEKKTFRIWLWLITLWNLVFIFILKSFTGMVLTVLLATALLIYSGIKSRNIPIKLGMLSLVLIIPGWFGWQFHESWNSFHVAPKVDFETLDDTTALGHPYEHDTSKYKIEEGRWIGLYICRQELEQAWNQRSDLDFFGSDRRNQPLQATLIRYLNAMNLRKDFKGVASLSDQDIRNIENGIANKRYARLFDLRSRIDQLVLGWITYQRKGDPNRNSTIQRLAYWKASLHIIAKHPVFGVGTGDSGQAFLEYYEHSNTRLKKQFQHRSHNQFLFTSITLGLVGLGWMLMAFLWPALRRKAFRQYLFVIYFAIATFSMLAENTLEPQAGVTFIAFFYGIYIFGMRPEKKTIHPSQKPARRRNNLRKPQKKG
jgi:hypothetical protein